jgi:hypothetical protein
MTGIRDVSPNVGKDLHVAEHLDSVDEEEEWGPF